LRGEKMKVNNLKNEDYEKIIVMEFPALSWLAILGNVTLALRHPQNIGASRSLVLLVRVQMEEQLMSHDIIDQEDINKMHGEDKMSGWIELCIN